MMKKLKVLMITLCMILLLSSVCINTNVFATNPEARDVGEPVTTSEDNQEGDSNEAIQEHEGDLYVIYGEDGIYTKSNYVMDKYVDGNVFIFGNDVKITGQINGSLFVFASSVTIEEEAFIGCHIFAFANTVKMSGTTYDMYAACKNFEMTNTGTIYRDLKYAAENSIVLGRVGRDLMISGENIEVYKSDEEQLYVARDLKYYSPEPIESLDKITVNGEKIHQKVKHEVSERGPLDYVYNAVENVIFAIAIYAALIFLTPKFVEKTKGYVSTRALLSGAIGLAFTILVPVIAFLLLLTSIGISISFTMVMIYALILMINSVIVTIAINEFVAEKLPAIDTTWKKILMIIPISLGVFLVRQIPVIGSWITAIILFVGVGITVLYQFDKRKKEETAE